jgi:hypothetical protein
MSAFLKTLFGDRNTVAAVTIVMLAEFLLAATGNATVAGLVVPCLVLAGAAWLARPLNPIAHPASRRQT